MICQVYFSCHSHEVISLLLIFFFCKFPTSSNRQFKSGIMTLLTDKILNPFYIDILILHMILTSIFVAIPVMMTEIYEISLDDFPQLYSSIFILSLAVTLPLLGYERKKPLLIRNLSLLILTLSLIFSFLFFNSSIVIIMTSLVCYIGAFSVLEAGIPQYSRRKLI